MPKTIHVVHGNDGKIISASESKNPPRPMNMQGLKVSEFEVPSQFKDKKMNEYIPLVFVDVASRQLRERGEEHRGKK